LGPWSRTQIRSEKEKIEKESKKMDSFECLSSLRPAESQGSEKKAGKVCGRMNLAGQAYVFRAKLAWKILSFLN